MRRPAPAKRFRDEAFRVEVGLRIRELRKQRGITAVELAARVGLADQSCLFHLERAHGGISVERLLLLADALDVTTDYLLGRTEARNG